MGLREKIERAAQIRPVESLEVPEFDGATVWFRPLTGAQQDKIHRKNLGDAGNVVLRALFILYTLCDEDGVLQYQDTLADLDQLQALPGELLDRLFTVAVRVAAVTPEAQEELAKNS